MNRIFYGFLVLVTTILMGTSFTIGKVGLEYLSPLLLVGIRFILAGALMVLFVIRRNHPKSISGWLQICAIGFFQTAGVWPAFSLACVL